jgi:hypothetical protein
MARIKIRNLIILTPLLLGLSGCATNMDDGTRTTIEGAAVGAALGAISCAFLKNKALCGAIAAGTAAIGAGAGYYVAQRKQGFATNEDYLDAEIQSAQQLNRDTAQRNEQTQQIVVNLQEQINKLSMQEQSSQSTKLALTNQSTKISRLIEMNKKDIKTLEQEYSIKDTLVKEERQKMKTGTQRFQALSTETEKLALNIKQLKDSNEQLAKMNNRISM